MFKNLVALSALLIFSTGALDAGDSQYMGGPGDLPPGTGTGSGTGTGTGTGTGGSGSGSGSGHGPYGPTGSGSGYYKDRM